MEYSVQGFLVYGVDIMQEISNEKVKTKSKI